VVCWLLTASKSPKVGHDIDLKTLRGLQVDKLGVFGVMGVLGGESWREKVSFGVLGGFPVVCRLLTASKSPRVGHGDGLETLQALQDDELGCFGVLWGIEKQKLGWKRDLWDFWVVPRGLLASDGLQKPQGWSWRWAGDP